MKNEFLNITDNLALDINLEEQTANKEIFEETISSNLVSDKELYNENLNLNNIDNTTNCLALTVKENYHMVVIRNAFKKSCRVSWKVAVSIFVINFLNMFL